MKLCFFTANYVPQHVMFIRQLIADYGAEVHSFYISEKFTYIPSGIDGLTTYKKSDLTREQLYEKVAGLKPALVYVAGYSNKDFLWAAKKVRKELQLPVISGCDTQWRGGPRQWLGIAMSRWFIRPSFSHFMVAGVYQFEWARKLGYKKEDIIFNMYSGDDKLFSQPELEPKRLKYPHNFLYVGRFVPEKGIEFMVSAWEKISDKKGWTLTLIGDGPLKQQFSDREDIVIKEYMPQDLLINEIQNSGCFILPSVFEPWAVVIHEFACAGLPVIATEVCGATPHFVISGFNGASIKAQSTSAIESAMRMIINSSDTELYQMSVNSRLMGKKITQQISAASLMSVLGKI
jgi:glycosyltransferase involved in cell wall biosynthesis